MRRLLALTILLAVGGPTTAAAAERTIASQPRPTQVKVHAGAALFSQWDGTAYRLVISRAAGTPEPLALPPQAVPFDADIGPDAQGRPTVVFSRCDADDCDLFSLRLGSTRAVRLTRTDDPERPELRPTLWRGQLAWVRRTRSGAGFLERVFTRSLAAPASVRSTSLPGVPRDGQVAELELYGRRLALSTVATRNDAGICGRREIRLVTLGRPAVGVVATQLCGLSGQTFTGPSFAAGRLYYARSCNEPADCRGPAFGALRYRIADASYASSPPTRKLVGWAYDADGRAYEVRDPTLQCERAGEVEGLPPCTVVRVSGLRFSPIRP